MDGKLRKKVPVELSSSPARIEGVMSLSPGEHHVRAISFQNGVEGSKVDFPALISSLPIAITAGENLVLDLLDPSQVNRTTNWKSHGGVLTAGYWRAWSGWNSVPANTTTQILVNVDMKNAAGATLMQDTCYRLEPTFDFLNIEVSCDGGVTFERVVHLDGGSPGKCQSQNFLTARADGEKGRRVLFKVSLESDMAIASSFLLKAARLAGN